MSRPDRRPVSLRNRISLVLFGAVALALVGANVATFAFVARGLDARVTEQVSGLTGFARSVNLAIAAGLRLPSNTTASSTDDLATSARSIVLLQPDGTRTWELFLARGGPDRRPPPVPSALPAEPGATIDVDTVGRVDGEDVPFRTRATRDASGSVIVVAYETSNLRQDLRSLVLLQAAATLAVLLVLVLLARRLVGLVLAPLARMEVAAEQIAGGDLTHRVEPSGPETEISRLGRTLNQMLTAIEGAFAEKERSEQRLRASEAKVREFASDASHELRTPLTSIRGYAQLLRRGRITDAEEVAAAAGRIEHEATRLTALVDDLLVLARLDEGEPLRLEPVDLTSLVGRVIDDVRVAEPGRVIGFEASGAVTTFADPDAIIRAVTNVVTNACHHTPPTTAIEVEVSGSDGTAVVAVVDHGDGVAEPLRARVFDRFVRADRSRSRSSGGAGLGLAIVDRLTSAHGGRCELTDTPGGGATFRIVLPAAPDPTLTTRGGLAPGAVVEAPRAEGNDVEGDRAGRVSSRRR